MLDRVNAERNPWSQSCRDCGGLDQQDAREERIAWEFDIADLRTSFPANDACPRIVVQAVPVAAEVRLLLERAPQQDGSAAVINSGMSPNLHEFGMAT